MELEKKKRKKRFQRDQTVSLKLTIRDREIIKWVYRHRFLSSEQIALLVGGSRQCILRRLNLLFHAGYLNRPQCQKVALGSNHCMVYGLGNNGAQILASEIDLPVETVDWTRKNREAKHIFLEHTLMVSRILVSFRLACWRQNGIEFIETDQLIKNRPVAPTIKTHPLSWRVDIGKSQYGGKKRFSFNLIPDSVFGLRIKKGNRVKEVYFFLEADRATMPVRRKNFYRSSFYKKMVGYVASYKHDLFSKHFGFKKIRVLVVTSSDKRISSMITENKSLHDLESGYGMFLFTKDEEIDVKSPERVFKQIWINGQGKNDSLYE